MRIKGTIEGDYDEPGDMLHGGGTMLGPAAHVNSACERCAICVFCVVDGATWALETRRALKADEPLHCTRSATPVQVAGST